MRVESLGPCGVAVGRGAVSEGPGVCSVCETRPPGPAAGTGPVAWVWVWGMCGPGPGCPAGTGLWGLCLCVVRNVSVSVRWMYVVWCVVVWVCWVSVVWSVCVSVWVVVLWLVGHVLPGVLVCVWDDLAEDVMLEVGVGLGLGLWSLVVDVVWVGGGLRV